MTRWVLPRRGVFAGEPLATVLRGVLKREDDYAAAAKPACDWDDKTARKALVDALAHDAYAVLALLDCQKLSPEVTEAAALVATVVGRSSADRCAAQRPEPAARAADPKTVGHQAADGRRMARRGGRGRSGQSSSPPLRQEALVQRLGDFDRHQRCHAMGKLRHQDHDERHERHDHPHAQDRRDHARPLRRAARGSLAEGSVGVSTFARGFPTPSPGREPGLQASRAGSVPRGRSARRSGDPWRSPARLSPLDSLASRTRPPPVRARLAVRRSSLRWLLAGRLRHGKCGRARRRPRPSRHA